MTTHIQPTDAGIIHAFKAHYRRLFILNAFEREEEGHTDIYKIDQLEAIRLCLRAWALITQETVTNCWKHSGILDPPTENIHSIDPINHDQGLHQAISQLQTAITSIAMTDIAPQNVPTVDEVLNVPSEQVTEEVWSDEDIIRQVQYNENTESEEMEEEQVVERRQPISLSEACRIINELSFLFETYAGSEYEQARSNLLKINRNFRNELTKSLKQGDIRSHFK